MLLILSLAIICYHFSDFKGAINQLNNISFLTIVVLLLLSILNWSLESLKWHYSLRFFKLHQPFKRTLQQIASGILAGLFLPKTLGHVVGRLSDFKTNNFVIAGKSQVLSSFVQTMALLLFFIISLSKLWILIMVICFAALTFLFKGAVYKLVASAFLRTTCIMASFMVAAWSFEPNILEWLQAVSKTFFSLSILPLTPWSSLGTKEWLLSYFYHEFSLEQCFTIGLTVFVFNLLVPTFISLLFLLADASFRRNTLNAVRQSFVSRSSTR